MAAEDSVKQLGGFVALGLNSVPVYTDGVEGTSQSWKAGAPLIRSSGKLVIAGTDAVADIVGFATAPASGTVDTPVSYIPALPGIVQFEATLEDQANGDHALVQTNQFVAYAMRATSGGLWYLDENDTTNVSALVLGFVDPIGTVQGRVRATLLTHVTAYTGANAND